MADSPTTAVAVCCSLAVVFGMVVAASRVNLPHATQDRSMAGIFFAHDIAEEETMFKKCTEAVDAGASGGCTSASIDHDRILILRRRSIDEDAERRNNDAPI